MTLPVALRHNADLTLTRETSSTTVDPTTGNVIPTTATVTLKVAIGEQPFKNVITQQAGYNLSDSLIRGYLLDPLPSGYQLKGVCRLRLFDTVTNISITGELSITPTITPYVNEIISTVGGRPFEGIFKVLETS